MSIRLFTIVSLIVLSVDRGEAHTCSDGLNTGECFNPAIETCNQPVSVANACPEFGEGVFAQSGTKADIQYGCCITKLGNPNPYSDPCGELFHSCDPQTFVRTCCVDGFTFIECQGNAVVKVRGSTRCDT